MLLYLYGLVVIRGPSALVLLVLLIKNKRKELNYYGTI